MREGGYTLVTVTIAIAVSAMLALAFFSGASNDTRIELLSRSHLVVKRLNSAVSAYYDSRCQFGAVPAPTVTDLVNDGLLNSAQEVAFTSGVILNNVNIDNTGPPPALFKYQVKFMSAGDAAIAAAGKMNAVVSGVYVTWTIVNDSNSRSSLSEGGEYLRAFGGNSC